MAYAARRNGVVGRREALAMGMSARTIARRVATGHLIAIAPGVLALPGATQTEEGLLQSAGTSIGGIASHQSAARLHQLTITDETTVAVTVPIRRTHRFHTAVVHQSTDLDPAQTLTINGIAVTDVCRTVIDLATELRPAALGDLVDQAVQLKLTEYETVRKRLEKLARRGKPGVVRLRRVLEQRSDTPVVTDSVLELRLVRILTVGGLPMPDTQFMPSWLRTVNGRVDVAYVTERVIVEADSRRWHNSPEAFQADRERDNLAQLAGWTILRYTWEDVTRRPEYVVATVRGALGRSRRV